MMAITLDFVLGLGIIDVIFSSAFPQIKTVLSTSALISI